MRAAVEKEAAVLMSAPHKHLVKVVGVDAHVEGEVRLFTEYVPGGTVASFLRRFGTLEEVVIQQYVRQCVLALAHLHAKGLAHRDLTVDNIMVASDGTIKLGGVGAGSLADRAADTHGDGTPNSCVICRHPTCVFGAVMYHAPLTRPCVCVDRIHSSQGRPKLEADIWDLGMAVLDMSLGIDAGRTESLTCPDDADAHATASGEEPPVPEALSAAGQTFVRRCLARDRSQRPSATDLLAMPFLEVGGWYLLIAVVLACITGGVRVCVCVCVCDRASTLRDPACSARQLWARVACCGTSAPGAHRDLHAVSLCRVVTPCCHKQIPPRQRGRGRGC